jgi:uncharacterized protein CbrC (UPF0167 family)
MNKEFPNFKYHPNPIATGMIRESDETCPCCGEKRGYAYTTNPYGETTVENLCPWCISDGSAAYKYNVEFTDGSPLARFGLESEIIDEVTHRTPGYVVWQQEEWLCCCNDACEFHGDLSVVEFRSYGSEVLVELRQKYELDDEDIYILKKNYKPGGSPAIYKFKCRHCGKVRLCMDFD